MIDRYSGASGQGFEEGGTGDAEGTADNGNAFTADDTEFNIFNTDRRLDALQTLSDQLSGIEQKKSVIYFSSGMNQSGTDNQVELRRTVDRATRANVSIYAADMRGLQAQVPGGDATQGSVRGKAAFSGASVSSQFDKMAATQDTLSTMAEDTGGRAFFDSNSFGDVFNRVVADTSAYYILGYSTTNPARDGRYRRIKVRLTKRTDLKLENRSGYYAPRDFAHSTKDDRQQQLQDQLMSDLSLTDLTAYVAPAYFRLSDNRFWVPLSVVDARLSGAVHARHRQEQVDHRRPRRRARRAEPAGRARQRHDEDRARRQRRFEAARRCSTKPAWSSRRASSTSRWWFARTRTARWARTKPTSSFRI